MHHQRVDLREGLAQAVEILMMMERVAAGPVDQADVGIGAGLAVVAIGRRRDCSSMSAMRATGMNSATPLRPCGRVGIGTAL